MKLHNFCLHYNKKSIYFFTFLTNIKLMMMSWCFMSLSTLFMSYWEDEEVIGKGSVHWSITQSWGKLCLPQDSNPGPHDPKSEVLTAPPYLLCIFYNYLHSLVTDITSGYRKSLPARSFHFSARYIIMLFALFMSHTCFHYCYDAYYHNIACFHSTTNILTPIHKITYLKTENISLETG